MTEASQPTPEPCTVLVLHPRDTALLVDAATGRPPVVIVPRASYGYAPAALVTAVRDTLGLDAALLRQLPERGSDGYECVVFVPRPTAGEPRDGLVWSAGPTGHAGADAALAELAGSPVDPRRAPWCHRHFPADFEAWTTGVLAAAGTPVTGPPEQVRVWELSCVWRAPTATGRVYVKATADSPLFTDEGTVTATLAVLFPGDVPAPLATDPDRHWMILPDLGPEMGWEGDPDEILDMVRAFARLQIASAGHLDALWRAGCVDRRLGRLTGYASSWLATADLGTSLDDAQRARLRGLAGELPDRLARLERFGLPDTLLHGDMHAGNVARRPGGFTWFDWSDASVGHPFVDMIAIRNADDEQRLADRRDAYLDEWRAFGTPEELRAAWDAAEVFTALHHAVSYASIVAHLEPPPEPDMAAEATRWLRRAVEAADRDRPVRPGQ